jgi:hypothetical protein
MLCQELNEMDIRDRSGAPTGPAVTSGVPVYAGAPGQVVMVPAGAQVVYVQAGPGQPAPTATAMYPGGPPMAAPTTVR